MYVKHDTFIELDGEAIPLDPENRAYAAYVDWLAMGNEPAAPGGPDLPRRIRALLAAVDAHLDAPAQARGYDNRITFALRAGYAGPYQAEGLAFAQWMDAVYARCYELLEQFNAGVIAEPTADELIAMLPALELA